MSDWVRVAGEEAAPEGRAVRAEGPDGPLMLLRIGDRVFAIADTCPHQGAPLHRGAVDLRGGTPIATCPAHGSMFDLATGAVRRGPALRPVAVYEGRIANGSVEVRAPD